MDLIEEFSTGLADRIAAAAAITVSVQTGKRPTSGILWRPDVVVVSEQMLPTESAALPVTQGGHTLNATLAGRDPSTNIAVLKLEAPIQAALPAIADPVRVGQLTLLGGAWHSMAGGRIDALIQLDARLGSDEGGPVLSLAGGLIGMSTSGPRRRTIVIPAVTVARVIDPLLTDGRIARGWLGIGLQPVMIPDSLRPMTERESGLMVVGLASGGPAETAGVLPGDIVLDIDDKPAGRPRALTAALGPDQIGETVTLRVLRAGAIQTIGVVVTARPAP
jgi:S1-C subfamily serine protease